jgi:hypothetical protein
MRHFRSFESEVTEALKAKGRSIVDRLDTQAVRLVNRIWREREAEINGGLWPFVSPEAGIRAMRRYWAKGGCTDLILEYVYGLEAEQSRIVNSPKHW